MDILLLLGSAFTIALASYLQVSGASYTFVALSVVASLAAQIAVYLGYSSLIYRWYLSPMRDLPHPKACETKFLLGNLIPFLSEPWGFPLARWQQTVTASPSGFYRVLLGPFDFLIPKSSQAVKAVMSQPYVFEKPCAVRDGLKQTVGVGLVTAEGDIHRRQKKLLTPIFGLSRNRRLVPQMWVKSVALADRIQSLIEESGSKSTLILMYPLTIAATLDVIAVTTLGVDFNSVQNPDQPFLEAYQRVFPSLEKQNAIERFFIATLPGFISPYLLFKLPLKPIRDYHKGIAVLRTLCLDQIRQKRREIEEAEMDDIDTKEKDILSAIVASGLQDEEEILSHILTILAGGHESTAITLAWAIFKLAQHPDVQDKLRNEVLDAEASGMGRDGAPSLDNINSLPYMRCFLMEVLRMYPAFPSMMRTPTRATKVEGLSIPKGKNIMVSPYAVNRSHELWGDDAEEFRVERWEKSHNGGATSSQAFLTFSSGPRTCIGKDFATLSLKVFLMVLVARFRFEEAIRGWHPPIQKGTTLKPQGLKVKVSLL